MNDEREEELRFEQRESFALWTRWAAAQRYTFNSGVVGLLAGTVTALVPVSGAPQPTLRWIAVGIAGLGLLVELIFPIVERRRSPN